MAGVVCVCATFVIENIRHTSVTGGARGDGGALAGRLRRPPSSSGLPVPRPGRARATTLTVTSGSAPLTCMRYT